MGVHSLRSNYRKASSDQPTGMRFCFSDLFLIECLFVNKVWGYDDLCCASFGCRLFMF